MIHDEVIESDSFLILHLPLNLQGTQFVLELHIPFVLKLLTSDEPAPEDANIRVKHIRIPAFLESLLQLTHLPIECFFIKIRYVLKQ
jgi:hypothetical protein